MNNVENHHMINQPWPEEDLEYIGRCPLCGSDQHTVLYEGLRDRTYFCALGSWTLHRCAGCNCAYLDPRPTPETIGRAYGRYYTHEIEGQEAPASLLKRIKQAAKNGYLNSKWGTSLFPASQTLGGLLPPSMRALLDASMRHLPRHGGERTLLDVGCGDGQFLALAQNVGWRVTGLDLDPVAVETARSKGINVQLGGIENLAKEADCFDAITISHVIEHVYNPDELLSSCYRLLKPSGFFWIETPNVDSYGHSEFKSDWRGLEPPRHLQLLSWSILQRMLTKTGFSQVTRAPWHAEYLGINCRSKAIIKGLPVAGTVHPTCLDIIKSQFVELQNRVDHTKREFITLYATK